MSYKLCYKYKTNKMANKFIKRLAFELKEVAKEVKPIGEAALMNIRLHDGVGYGLSDEASIHFNEVVSKILKHQKFSQKFSSKYVDDKVKQIFANLITNDKLDLETELERLIKELASYKRNNLIFLKIEGIILSSCFKLGKVKFVPGDEYLLNDLNERASRIAKTTKNDDSTKKYFLDLIENESKNEFLGECVAIVEVNAEPKRAYDIAKEEVRRAIDLLRYASKALYGLKDDIRIGLKGDHPKSRRQGFIISDSSLNTEGDTVGSPIPFEISSKTLEKMEKIGVFKISEALAKSQTNNLEESIIRSIHWFSVALTQNENSNSFLFLIVSLESLFKPPAGNSIGGTVAESVAFVMSDSLQGRKQIIKKIRSYYGKRSGVAHGGNKTIADHELHTLIYIIATTIMLIIEKLSEFSTQQNLMDWIEEIKLK